MPRGGRRPGAGRKPGSNVLRHVPLKPPTTNPTSPIEEFDAPDDLAADERAIWLKQAPFAFKNRTLTRGTALVFERYCKVVALERMIAAGSEKGGSDHRGLLRQINTYEIQFMLAPNGRPVMEVAVVDAPSVEPESRLAQFRG